MINQSIFLPNYKQKLSMRSSIRYIPLMHSVHLKIYNQFISPGNTIQLDQNNVNFLHKFLSSKFYFIRCYRKYTNTILNMYMMNMISYNLVFKTVYCIMKYDAILYHLNSYDEFIFPKGLCK